MAQKRSKSLNFYAALVILLILSNLESRNRCGSVEKL
jgi:hypothetical protein